MSLGCFLDEGPYDLSGGYTRSHCMTVELCGNYCEMLGFLYAGLQDGYRCHCDNSFGRYGATNPSTCNSPCCGNKEQTCGGNYRMDIYYLGV